MGSQKNNGNQQNQPSDSVGPTSDQPTWEFAYKNGAESLDIKIHGEASQAFNQGAQAALHELIQKINSPAQSPMAWIESPYHQPTYRQPQTQPMLSPAPMPALPPSPTPAPLMLAAAQTPQPQTPNENFTHPPSQPASLPLPITVIPVPVSTSLPVIPTTTAAKRPGNSRQAISLWGGRALLGAEIALGVFCFYLIFINSSTRERLWKYVSPPAVEQTKPAK